MFRNAIQNICVVFFVFAMPASSQDGELLRHYREVRPIDSTFSSLIRRVEAISEMSVCINDPANEAEILAAEKLLGIAFPEDLRSLYMLANGQRQGAECAPLLWDGGVFMPLGNVLGHWALMKDLWESQDDFRTDYGSQGAVQGFHWMPEWVPVGDFGNGDLFCIDFAPADEGVMGQIIYFIHDDTTRSQESADINSFIGSMDDALRRDVVSYTTGYGVRMKQ